ncbi:hypothetical protein [Deinococcus apachensis]|uniref:hypothetical protein n=1 Tax=Deinococcus apachensis TaxID=309886 RepID=UPI0003696EA9|nr:hypothetical protein [Deinococcus apachensis]
MRPAVLFTVLLALGGSPAWADTQPAEQGRGDAIRVTSLNDGRFRFVLGPAQSVLDLGSGLSGCTGSLYDGATGEQYGGNVRARVLDEVRGAGFWYVVMQVNTNTGCNVQGLCGAGLSTDMLWLKLDVRLRAVARQAASVEDCGTDTELTQFDGRRPEGDDPRLEMRGGVLSLESRQDDYTRKVTTVTALRYDRRSPERGLVRSTRQMPLK